MTPQHRHITLLFLLLLPALAWTQKKVEADIVQAWQKLSVGKNLTRHDFTSATDTITFASTHQEIPTALAVWNLLAGLGGSGLDTVITDATLSGYGTDADPLGLAQQGATAGQVLRWSGSAWVAKGTNLYYVVTSSQTVNTQFNQIFVNTLSAAITLNLPPCNSSNDHVSFEFIKAGADIYPAHIEPDGSEQFNDSSTTKTLYSQGTRMLCTCRWNSGTGTWFYSNM